ncbi:MAG: hypothetical protein J1G06_09350 [Oscillospiraceae bacterium]|nr:hypothetical protein [Oscillospiraceae bacterium]
MSNLPAIANNIPSGGLNLSKLSELSNCIETVAIENPKLSISVLPNVFKDIFNFFHENKRLKIQNEQFKQKCAVIKDYTEKQYNLELYKVKQDAYTKLSQIKSSENKEIARINRETNMKMVEIKNKYHLESSRLYTNFKKFQSQMRLENKRFELFAMQLREQQKNHEKCLKELEAVCAILRKKMNNNTATKNDFDYYLLLMDMRMKYACNQDILSIVAEGLRG